MDAELIRRVEALRRPLELAAADGFAGVRKVQGLGNALRAACDGVLARLAAGQTSVAGLDSWRARLAGWEQLDEQQQQIEVARGLRFLQRLPRAQPAATRAHRPTFELPELPAASEPDRPLPTSEPLARLASRPAPPPAPAADAKPVERAERIKPGAPARSPDGGKPVERAKLATQAKPASRARPAQEANAAKPAVQTNAADGAKIADGARPAEIAKLVEAAKLVEPTNQTERAKPAAQSKPAERARPAAGSKPEPPVDPLAAPTHSLPGIGPAFADKLAERGLVTVEDLLWLVPRRYDDVRDARPLAEVCGQPDGTRATFVAQVASARMVFARGRRWAEVRLGNVDITARASALVRWFNVFAGIDKRMPPGSQVVLSGVLRTRGGRTELANPDILGVEIEGAASSKAPPAILARYPDVPGVPPGRLRSACAAACARVAGAVEDGVPATVERAAELPSLADTLAQLHSPPADTAPADLAAMNRGDSRWQRRLAFGELFALGVAITLRRRTRRADAAVPCPRAPQLAAQLARALPFSLTGAQRRSIDELGGDLAQSTPMNRLLQGDVGAGKTAVAFAAALQVAAAGRQTAVMAPTELLAEQHAETWRAWARAESIDSGRQQNKAGNHLRLALLTASTPKGVRASTLALLVAGELDVVIGTHALIAESVGFAALGLVVIDEQHRFGVAQRARLRDKGDGQGAPHLLVMTATPIPRTLALTAYGDLDVSVLDELPPGRHPVATRMLTGARGQTAAYKLIAERVAAGERAYIVCPKVEPGDGDEDSRDWKDATTVAAEVAAALPQVRTGLVHGRLDAAARDRVMRSFKAGELDALVATTVIEVGVDVPAATVMVIHDADRFGLAQLHQLRGRVGRGGGAAHCLLLTQGGVSEDARRRLDVMVASHDGFRIAEEDLALRGPGELLGPKQAGVPRLRFGDLAQHTQLLLEARRHAEAVLADDPLLASPANAALRRALERRLASSVYGAEAG